MFFSLSNSWPVRTLSFSFDSEIIASASEDLYIDLVWWGYSDVGYRGVGYRYGVHTERLFFFHLNEHTHTGLHCYR